MVKKYLPPTTTLQSYVPAPTVLTPEVQQGNSLENLQQMTEVMVTDFQQFLDVRPQVIPQGDMLSTWFFGWCERKRLTQYIRQAEVVRELQGNLLTMLQNYASAQSQILGIKEREMMVAKTKMDMSILFSTYALQDSKNKHEQEELAMQARLLPKREEAELAELEAQIADANKRRQRASEDLIEPKDVYTVRGNKAVS